MTTSDSPSNLDKSQEAPQMVTGNSYSIFTTKNYGDEMHWFLMGLLTSAQEAIGASWAAATAEAPVINTSDSGEDYLSATDSPT